MGQSKSATHLAEVVAPVTKFISYMISNYCRICPCIRHSSLFSCITIRECSYANDNRKVFTLTATVPEKLRKLTKEFLSEVYNKQESSAYILTLTVYGSIFIQMFLMGSVKRFFFCNSVVQGHLRSLILVPIESVYATSCQSIIVTLVLSCTISEILQVYSHDPTPIPP